MLAALRVLAEYGASPDGHARVLAYPLQVLDERPQVLVAAGALVGEAGDGPHLDVDARVELLAPHVPHTLVGRGLRARLLKF